jgi:hypothetical protein
MTASLGAVQVELSLEGGVLIALHQRGGLGALVGEEQRDGHGAGLIALAHWSGPAVPVEPQAIAVRPGAIG